MVCPCNVLFKQRLNEATSRLELSEVASSPLCSASNGLINHDTSLHGGGKKKHKSNKEQLPEPPELTCTHCYTRWDATPFMQTSPHGAGVDIDCPALLTSLHVLAHSCCQPKLNSMFTPLFFFLSVSMFIPELRHSSACMSSHESSKQTGKLLF